SGVRREARLERVDVQLRERSVESLCVLGEAVTPRRADGLEVTRRRGAGKRVVRLGPRGDEDRAQVVAAARKDLALDVDRGLGRIHLRVPGRRGDLRLRRDVRLGDGVESRVYVRPAVAVEL